MNVQYQVPAPEWDQFVRDHPCGHVLQTSRWGTHQVAFGWHVERTIVRDQDAIAAGTQVLFRPLQFGLTRAYIPKGPLVDLADRAVCGTLFEGIHRLCRTRYAISLKIEPELVAPDLAAVLSSYGLNPSPHTVQPPRTITVDISGSHDQILGRMKSKTRYNIRLAERNGIRIHEGQRQDMATFHQLLDLTSKRDAFVVHNPLYYERTYDLFVPAKMARLFLATYGEQPVAAIMVFVLGRRAWYMYGASGNKHREKMPNYALQWAAMRWAKDQGCTSYDLWGVPDEDESTLETQFANRGDGLWGVYRFKRGFGGDLVRYAGAFDCIYNRPLYRLYRLALELKYRGKKADHELPID